MTYVPENIETEYLYDSNQNLIHEITKAPTHSDPDTVKYSRTGNLIFGISKSRFASAKLYYSQNLDSTASFDSLGVLIAKYVCLYNSTPDLSTAYTNRFHPLITNKNERISQSYTNMSTGPTETVVNIFSRTYDKQNYPVTEKNMYNWKLASITYYTYY
jgi:hypothetical protein